MAVSSSTQFPEPLVRNISDTARWAAIYRAWESKRPDALIHDPFAERLAGERGDKIANQMKFSLRHGWSFIARTCLFDEIILEQIAGGTEMVINLASGLDARPYRMVLPPSLTWVEVDLPGILQDKQEILRSERPTCVLEQIKLDLTDVSARREVFARLGSTAKKAMILCEGLLIYLCREEVAALISDLAGPRSFQNILLDMVSPALLRVMQKRMGSHLESAGAEFKFGPVEGPDFFRPFGWTPVRVQSMLHTAARIKRLPLWMRPFALFPDKFPREGVRPWGAACLLARK